MINHEEKERRKECLRKWYFRQRTPRDRSAARNLIVQKMGINHYRFYCMLEGRSYINDYRMRKINEVINTGTINRAAEGVLVMDGLEINIFENYELSGIETSHLG